MKFLGKIAFAGVSLSLLFLGMDVSPSAAQEKPKKHVVQMPSNFLQTQGSEAHFGRTSKVPAGTNIESPRIVSVRHFTRAFNYQGQAYPYTMVGFPPETGQTAHLENSVTPIILVFPDIVDQNNNPIVIDPTALLPALAASPLWHNSRFSSGNTQFGDAVQRAAFFSSDDEHEWHVRLLPPRINPALVVEVPGDDAEVGQLPDGTIFAIVDSEFWDSQVNTILQLGNYGLDDLPILMTSNTVLDDESDFITLQTCCTIGFHGAVLTAQNGNTQKLQTFVYASWITTPQLFAPGLTDIWTFSHEVAEWLNDPFVNNIVPPWSNPEFAGGPCSPLLEVGDPLVPFTTTVSLNGFDYHPQTVALLQWFSRQQPSKAIDGAYSYPDETVLTSPAAVCTPPAAAAAAKTQP